MPIYTAKPGNLKSVELARAEYERIYKPIHFNNFEDMHQ